MKNLHSIAMVVFPVTAIANFITAFVTGDALYTVIGGFWTYMTRREFKKEKKTPDN